MIAVILISSRVVGPRPRLSLLNPHVVFLSGLPRLQESGGFLGLIQAEEFRVAAGWPPHGVTGGGVTDLVIHVPLPPLPRARPPKPVAGIAPPEETPRQTGTYPGPTFRARPRNPHSGAGRRKMAAVVCGSEGSSRLSGASSAPPPYAASSSSRSPAATART